MKLTPTSSCRFSSSCMACLPISGLSWILPRRVQRSTRARFPPPSRPLRHPQDLPNVNGRSLDKLSYIPSRHVYRRILAILMVPILIQKLARTVGAPCSMLSWIVEGVMVSGVLSHNLLSSLRVELLHDVRRSVGPHPCFREPL